VLDRGSSRSYGQGRGYRDGYEYQNRGQRYDQQYYDDGHSYRSRGRGGQQYYDDDYYYDSQTGYGGSSHRGHGNYRQHNDGNYRSTYTYRADGQPNTYNTRSYAPSTGRLQTTDEQL